MLPPALRNAYRTITLCVGLKSQSTSCWGRNVSAPVRRRASCNCSRCDWVSRPSHGDSPRLSMTQRPLSYSVSDSLHIPALHWPPSTYTAATVGALPVPAGTAVATPDRVPLDGVVEGDAAEVQPASASSAARDTSRRIEVVMTNLPLPMP